MDHPAKEAYSGTQRPARPRRAAVVLLVLAATCGDAPRDNPLDPQTGRFAPVSGRAMTLFPPHQPLEGVQVAVSAFGVFDTTDSEGSFTLPYLPPVALSLVAHGSALAPCTLSVPPSGPARENVEFYLDALPRITQATATSTWEERWWPEPYAEWITVSTRVDDGDGIGDVDSVWCIAGGVGLPLTPEITPGSFKTVLNEGVQSPFNAESFVGSDFVFQARDRQGAVSTAHTVRLVRVVREVGTLTSPTGLEEVGRTPVLRWIPPAPEYPSALRVRVIRVDSGVETTAWESPLYPALTDSARVGTPLGVGTYYWALCTIDSFGNTGRSREAAFRVAS